MHLHGVPAPPRPVCAITEPRQASDLHLGKGSGVPCLRGGACVAWCVVFRHTECGASCLAASARAPEAEFKVNGQPWEAGCHCCYQTVGLAHGPCFSLHPLASFLTQSQVHAEVLLQHCLLTASDCTPCRAQKGNLMGLLLSSL